VLQGLTVASGSVDGASGSFGGAPGLRHFLAQSVADSFWAEIKSGKVSYRIVGMPDGGERVFRRGNRSRDACSHREGVFFG
jgi:hypothetical protein